MARRIMDDSELKDPERSAPAPVNVRPCHDCGHTTTDYRCARCKITHAMRHSVTEGDAESAWIEDYAVWA